MHREGLWRFSFCKSEVKGAGILGREAFAKRFSNLPSAFVGVDGDAGADGVECGGEEEEKEEVLHCGES